MEQLHELKFIKTDENARLILNFCGHAKTLPGHSFGPCVRPTFLIHYILSGKGIFQIGKQKYELSKGDGFLIEPDVLTFYKADETDPWEYIWCGFSGGDVQDLLRGYNLTAEMPIFHCTDEKAVVDIVNAMLKYCSASREDDLRRTGLLHCFLAEVLACCSGSTFSQSENDNYYIRKAVDFIRSQYNTGIGVSEIAAHCNISRNYLYTLFHTYYNTSVKKFLTRFRMTRAVELLSLTELPVKTIAYSCGYHDPVVFSKVFKEYTGESPVSIRRKKLEEIQWNMKNSIMVDLAHK